MKVLLCVRNGWRLEAFRGSLYPQRFQPLLCATDSADSMAQQGRQLVIVLEYMSSNQHGQLQRHVIRATAPQGLNEDLQVIVVSWV